MLWSSDRPPQVYENSGWRSTAKEISRDLEPGVTLVIAEVGDPDPRALDSALEALGGSVTRRAAGDVYAELDAASGSTGRRP